MTDIQSFSRKYLGFKGASDGDITDCKSKPTAGAFLCGYTHLLRMGQKLNLLFES